MASITELVQIITYRGTPLDFQEEAFLWRVDSISRQSRNGSGYATWQNGTQLPPFTTFDYDQGYIIVSKPGSLPYEIPENVPPIVGGGMPYELGSSPSLFDTNYESYG